ncbi:hypothetical protein L7F22_024695 [Adiantum nelumboides]|nr:hypothetical protein [Adiantum nelumboides]
MSLAMEAWTTAQWHVKKKSREHATFESPTDDEVQGSWLLETWPPPFSEYSTGPCDEEIFGHYYMSICGTQGLWRSYACITTCHLVARENCAECGASSQQQTRYHSLGLHDPTGSLYWQVVRSRLRSGEAQEEEKDMSEALRELERGTHGDEPTADADSMLWRRSNEEKEEEVEEEKGEEKEERHPADELLQSLQADATISYILGGY